MQDLAGTKVTPTFGAEVRGTNSKNWMVSDNFQCKKSTLPPRKLFESEYVQHLKDIFANLQSNLTSSSKLTA